MEDTDVSQWDLSGWSMMSTISPLAPFVMSRLISIFEVTMTLMPTAICMVSGRSLALLL